MRRCWQGVGLSFVYIRLMVNYDPGDRAGSAAGILTDEIRFHRSRFSAYRLNPKVTGGKLSRQEGPKKILGLRFKSLRLPAEKPGKEVAMKAAAEFIKRMEEDAEFRQKVNAFHEGEERLAFLKSEGYDFSPFVRILNNLSSGHQAAGGAGPPGARASRKPGASGFLGRLNQIFHPHRDPRTDR
jgi:hypothetical protein